jgi:hypothetical protein
MFMKRIIIILLTLIMAVAAHAQLSGTSWNGTLTLDQPIDVFFNFSNDTLDVLNAQDNSGMETMKYMISDTVLTLQKLFGHSICDNATVGTYKCIITNDHMLLEAASDACDDRKDAIGKMDLSKVK